MTPREAIAPILERIQDMDVVRVIVFGSTASGELHTDSDLDLAIVVADPHNPEAFDRVQRALEIRRRIRDINREVALDIFVYSQSEFEELASAPSSVRAELVEAGETVYERAG